MKSMPIHQLTLVWIYKGGDNRKNIDPSIDFSLNEQMVKIKKILLYIYCIYIYAQGKIWIGDSQKPKTTIGKTEYYQLIRYIDMIMIMIMVMVMVMVMVIVMVININLI